MELQWPINVEKRIYKTEKVMVSTLAYADDTTWVAESKTALQKIIQVSNSFFTLNDIEINGAKSEAIAWRPHKQEKEENSIQMGTPPSLVKVKKLEESTRFLGVWISLRKQEKTSTSRCKKEVSKLTSILRYKKLSASQIIYINNMVLLPKLEYLLANVYLKKKSLTQYINLCLD